MFVTGCFVNLTFSKSKMILHKSQVFCTPEGGYSGKGINTTCIILRMHGNYHTSMMCVLACIYQGFGNHRRVKVSIRRVAADELQQSAWFDEYINPLGSHYPSPCGLSQDRSSIRLSLSRRAPIPYRTQPSAQVQLS